MWRSVSARIRCFGLKVSGSFRACHGTPVVPAEGVTGLEALRLWRRSFQEGGVPEAKSSARHILAYLLGAKTIEGVRQEVLEELLSLEQTERLWQLCTLRLSRMPVQYVIGQWDFRELTLKMRPPVFIPRPETEELVQLVLTHLLQSGVARGGTVLEVGCGSGAVALSLLSALPQLNVVAVDCSQDALDLTMENALQLGLQDRLKLHRIDIMTEPHLLQSVCSSSSFSSSPPLSLLVSNPPYLYSEDMATLEQEVYRFEDHGALDGGEDGLRVVRRILSLAPPLLQDKGRVFLEVEPRHPPIIQRWMEEEEMKGRRQFGEEEEEKKRRKGKMSYVETKEDITGRPRFCILQKESS